MTVEHLQRKREHLLDAYRKVAAQLEQLRGAISLCNELLEELQGNGVAPESPDVMTDGVGHDH